MSKKSLSKITSEEYLNKIKLGYVVKIENHFYVNIGGYLIQVEKINKDRPVKDLDPNTVDNIFNSKGDIIGIHKDGEYNG